MQFEIKVVEQDGEKLFEYTDGTETVVFHYLDSYKFVGGKLNILRDRELFSKSDYIQMYGTHGAGTAFWGLREVFNDGAIHHDVIQASQLETGDVIQIEMRDDFSPHIMMEEAKYIRNGMSGLKV